jgi:hypothetical protein
MKAYGIPVQSVVTWKQPSNGQEVVVTSGGNALIGAFVKAEPIVSSSTNNTNGHGGLNVRSVAVTTCNSVMVSSCGNDSASNCGESDTETTPVGTPKPSIKQEVPDLEGCHGLTSKQLEEFMDDDCHGPVSSGDPMLSSPHLRY